MKAGQSRVSRGEKIVITNCGRSVAMLVRPERESDVDVESLQATAFLSRLAGLSLSVDSQTIARAWSDTIALARAHGLSTYDAAYLELAVRESLPLASLDVPLKNAAKSIGVPFFVP